MKTYCIRNYTTQKQDCDHFGRFGLNSVDLSFRLEEVDSGQPITRGRMVVEPEIDLRDYRFKAVIDWLEISVRANKPVSTINLGPRLAKRFPGYGLYVSGRERSDGYYGDKLLFRLQDPTERRVEDVMRFLERLPEFSGQNPRERHELTGLEVAVDIYPMHARKLSGQEFIKRRVRMSELVRRFIMLHEDFHDARLHRDVNDWPRYVDEVGKGPKLLFSPAPGARARHHREIDEIYLAARNLERHRTPPINATMYIGAENSEVMLRLQDKTKDQRRDSEKVKELPLHARRTRVEISMLKIDWERQSFLSSLGLHSVNDLQDFRFRKLADRAFRFQKPTISTIVKDFPNPAELYIFRETGLIGLDCSQRCRSLERSRSGSTRDKTVRRLGAKGFGLRYTQMNKRVGAALDRLMTSYQA